MRFNHTERGVIIVKNCPKPVFEPKSLTLRSNRLQLSYLDDIQVSTSYSYLLTDTHTHSHDGIFS